MGTDAMIQDKPAQEKGREVVAKMIRQLQDGRKWREIFQLDGPTMSGLEAQVYKLYRNRLFERAQIAGRGVLALDGDRLMVRVLMGDMALAEYRFSEAVEHLRIAHKLDPEAAVVRARLGEAMLKSGKPQGAAEHLRAALQSDDLGPADRRRCQLLLDAIK